jgi:hypothetical protein
MHREACTFYLTGLIRSSRRQQTYGCYGGILTASGHISRPGRIFDNYRNKKMRKETSVTRYIRVHIIFESANMAPSSVILIEGEGTHV